MKKVLAIAVLGVFVLASCKKDRTCECCYTGTISGYDPGCSTYTAKLKKSDAETWCETNGSSSYYTCTLK